MDPLGVAVGGEVGRLDVMAIVDAGRVQLLLAHRVGEQRLDRELLAVERDGARLEAGEVEQLGDEPAEPLDLGEHGAAASSGSARLDAVDEVLERRPAAR